MALGLLIPAARAQVQVAPETFLRLNADASIGYVTSSAQGGLNSVNFGLGADLSGYFYHPNFLNFQFAPYYNQGREYSTADFISGDKGFSTSANLFAGSRIPLFVNYSKGATKSGLYGVVGSESSVVGEGSNDNLNVNWSARFEKVPSFQAGYFRSGGEYRILGASGSRGESHASGYLLASQYSVLGFLLGASYTSQRLGQLVPSVFLTDQKSRSNTDQKNLEFSLSRQVGKNTFFDAVASRSHYDTDATTLPQNRRYDTLRSGFTSRPLPRLATSFRFNYVSDLNALLISSVLPGSSGGTGPLLLAPLESRTKYLTYSGSGSYDISRALNVRTAYRRGLGKFTGRAGNEDSAWNNSVDYRRSLLGGRLTTSYSMGIYRFENGGAETSSQGHSGTMVFSKTVRGWEHFGTFQYSTSDIESLLPGHMDMLSAEFGTSGMIRSWRMISTFRYEKTDSIFNSQAENRRRMVRVSLTKRRLQLGASFQSGSGLSIVSISGVQPATGPPAVVGGSGFERLLIPSESFSLSFSGSYQLRRRTTFNGSWSKMDYSTMQAGIEKSNELNQLNFHVRHRFRQLDCRAGYRRYHQKLAAGNGLYNANTVYFQVSRHFNVF
jgi:hypothetical protein